MSIFKTILVGILIPLGLFLVFLVFMARPDSFEEMQAGMSFGWVPIGPIFGLIAYLLFPFSQKPTLVKRLIAIALCVGVWVVTAKLSERIIISNVKARLGEDFDSAYQDYLNSQP